MLVGPVVNWPLVQVVPFLCPKIWLGRADRKWMDEGILSVPFDPFCCLSEFGLHGWDRWTHGQSALSLYRLLISTDEHTPSAEKHTALQYPSRTSLLRMCWPCSTTSCLMQAAGFFYFFVRRFFFLVGVMSLRTEFAPKISSNSYLCLLCLNNTAY